jgi:hypothetical protein
VALFALPISHFRIRQRGYTSLHRLSLSLNPASSHTRNDSIIYSTAQFHISLPTLKRTATTKCIHSASNETNLGSFPEHMAWAQLQHQNEPCVQLRLMRLPPQTQHKRLRSYDLCIDYPSLNLLELFFCGRSAFITTNVLPGGRITERALFWKRLTDGSRKTEYSTAKD